MLSALLINLSSAEAKNCGDKLVGNSYNCIAKDTKGESGSGCFEFESGGISDDFDLLVEGQDYGCACDASGSVSSPSFDSSSSSFECLSVAVGFLINGKLKGNKIAAQGIEESGFTQIFDCTKSSTPCP